MKQLSMKDGSPNNIRILLYHRIYTEAAAGRITPWDISERVFRRHIELLNRWGYSSITFQDYSLYLKGKLSLPKKPVIITFDDGYEETVTVAHPIMKTFGMRGVVFLLGDRSIRTNCWDLPEDAGQRLLTDQQALELHRGGFEIGAHSYRHRRLTELTAADAWEDISRSRIMLEFLLNAPVTSFSYPYGLLNDEIKTMIADAGYMLACGAYTGPAVYSADPFELRRIRTYNSPNPILFWFQLQSAYLHYRALWWNMKMEFKTITSRFSTVPENV